MMRTASSFRLWLTSSGCRTRFSSGELAESKLIHPLGSRRGQLANARNKSFVRIHLTTTRQSQLSQFCTSAVQHNTPGFIRPPLKDPSHPSLFYHLLTSKPSGKHVFALSFLDVHPASVRSKTILGWLPAEGNEEGESGLNDFEENRDFIPLLHEAVKSGLLEDEIWRNGATQTHSGWMHIFDQRNPPPLGRIPDVDDILASVLVEDGQMLVDTYQAMPSYRLCTGDGVCQLTDGLTKRLTEVLQCMTAEERNVIES